MKWKQLIVCFKNWLIHKLGGFTFKEYVKFGKYYYNYGIYSELNDIKYFMESNYGTNWSSELYQKVLNRIIELQDIIDNEN